MAAKIDPKRKVGRPRTATDDLRPDWKETIIAIATDGGSAVEIRVALGISQGAWETLLADSEEFLLTVKTAHDACQTWWEKKGRTLAVDGGGNAAIYIFNMKNRFGWRDKAEDGGRESDKPAPTQVVVEVRDARKP